MQGLSLFADRAFERGDGFRRKPFVVTEPSPADRLCDYGEIGGIYPCVCTQAEVLAVHTCVFRISSVEFRRGQSSPLRSHNPQGVSDRRISLGLRCW